MLVISVEMTVPLETSPSSRERTGAFGDGMLNDTSCSF